MRILALLAVLALGGSACGSGSPTAPSSQPSPGSVPYSQTDLRDGTGAATASSGRLVTVRYTGWLYSTTAPDNKGTQFDSGTFSFVVGTTVIQGFNRGVGGMRVGGIRRVVIPPDLGYGGQANGAIPPNSTLLFEIECLAIQ